VSDTVRMRRRTTLVSSVLLLVLLVAAAAVLAVGRLGPRFTEVEAPALSQQVTAAPPLRNAVQDAGVSVTLPDGRALWVFGDTAQIDAKPHFFVTSSAGVTSGRGTDLTYLTGPGGTPVEFLQRTPQEQARQQPGVHYTAIWPTGATWLPDGRVIIGYAKYAVQYQPTTSFTFLGGGLYEYRPGAALRTTGAYPATRLANDIFTPADGPIGSPTYYQGYVYFLRCDEKYECYSARTTPANLGNRWSYEWFTGTAWNGNKFFAAKVPFGSDVPGRNPSVVFSRQLGLFVMADTSGGIQSRTGRLWVARQPWGPWSTAATYDLPQCPEKGCYTLNVHPDQAAPGSMRVSFATDGLGPYVRVVDVPIRTDDAGPVPSIATHDSGGPAWTRFAPGG
jgi:hypothetical protein